MEEKHINRWRNRIGIWPFLLIVVLFMTGCAREILYEIPGELAFPEKEIVFPAAPKGDESNIRNAEEVKDDSGETAAEDILLEDVVFLMPEAGDYAGRTLSPEKQLWYADMIKILSCMEEDKILSENGLKAGLKEADIDEIFQCVMIDHPEFFFVDGYTYTLYTRGDDVVKVEFSGIYNVTKEEALNRKQEIELAADLILEELSPELSEYDKVKYVYEQIIRLTDYDLEAPDNQNIYSVFGNRKSVCQGYAKACQYLLNRLGLECVLVQGSIDTGEGHAWNLVKIDGSYYYIDSTWGDASYKDSEGEITDYDAPEVDYSYLGITTRELLKNHSIDTLIPMPECVDIAANYYVHEGALFEEYDKEALMSLFEKYFLEGKQDVTVKCSDRSCYDAFKEALIDNQEIFELLNSESVTIGYLENSEQRTLTFWVTNE